MHRGVSEEVSTSAMSFHIASGVYLRQELHQTMNHTRKDLETIAMTARSIKLVGP